MPPSTRMFDFFHALERLTYRELKDIGYLLATCAEEDSPESGPDYAELLDNAAEAFVSANEEDD